MNRKVEKIIIRLFTTFLLSLIIFASTDGFMGGIPIFKKANASDITSDLDTSTYLKLAIPPEIPPQPPVPPPYKMEPIINWYDLQTIDGISVLNSKIDVNQEYRFCIYITSDQGWDDIEYINITAWFDNCDDSSTYNQSQGGNINMFLQYQNISGNANYVMLWPDDEVIIGSFIEKENISQNGIVEDSECHNLSFSFIPNYQFRYAPGDGSWDTTKNAINDIGSWNFEISVSDKGDGTFQSKTSSIFDEFGVNSYSEIISIGLPSINGLPGENASDISSLSIKTRSNIDYSLSVDMDTLIHEDNPIATISKDKMWVKGGDLSEFMNFDNYNSVYFYGSLTTYTKADNNNTMKITENIDYKCDIPFGQIPGNYSTTVRYKMNIQMV